MFEKSVPCLLTYLGRNPITSTRYFWQLSHPGTPNMSIMLAPHMLVPVINAILIRHYGCPDVPGRMRIRDKRYLSRREWAEGERGSSIEHESCSNGRPNKTWMLGLRDYFTQQPSTTAKENTRLGFAIGRQMVGLYLIEIALKFALDERTIKYTKSHNIEVLFSSLPEDVRERLRCRYVRILHSEPGHAWGFQASIDDLVRHLAGDPITVTRYYWDSRTTKRGIVQFNPAMLVALVDAILCELHGFDLGQPIEEFERDFQSFDASMVEMRKRDDSTAHQR